MGGVNALSCFTSRVRRCRLNCVICVWVYVSVRERESIYTGTGRIECHRAGRKSNSTCERGRRDPGERAGREGGRQAENLFVSLSQSRYVLGRKKQANASRRVRAAFVKRI